MWHAGLMYKLTEFQCPPYIWHLLDKWYSQSTSAVLWNSCISRSFRVQQGVCQGAILSPLLYSIFVNSLLDQLTASGCGAHIGNVYCGAPMYADDLALISSSEADLYLMLSMVSDYALLWRYHFNAAKSAVLVFGESPVSRKKNRPLRKWLVSGSLIPECDSQHHLGILRTISPSSVLRTFERCSSGCSAFFCI